MIGHIQHSLSSNAFSEDALQQIWPFFKYQNPELFKDDYIGQYYLDCMPQGYKALMIGLAQLGDLRILSKCLIYPLLALILVVMARNGRTLAGEIGMWMAIVCVLGFDIYLLRMVGGLPRSFALPLLALVLMALLEKRPLLLAVTTVVASLFYPVASVIGGITLTCWLLLLDQRNRDLPQAWKPLPKRIALIGVAGVLSLACILPTMYQSSAYGRKIDKHAVDQFPELARGGRYLPSDSYPFDTVARTVLRGTIDVAQPKGGTWPGIGRLAESQLTDKGIRVKHVVFWFFCATGLIVCIVRLFKDPAFCRLLLFVLICMTLFVLAKPVYPSLYMPGRYSEYMIYLVSILLLPLLPTSVELGLKKRASLKRLGPFVSVGLCVLIVLIVTRRGDDKAGYNILLKPQASVLSVLPELEVDAKLAGWFGYPLQLVPYLYKRPVLVSFELHQVFHESYALAMRERTVAVIEAYYPNSLQDVLNLRDNMQVSHFLITRNHLRKAPTYFKPYGRYVQQRFTQSKMSELLEGTLKPAIIFEDELYVLLDLRLIAENASSNLR
ncbi:MAG: hypothetical protein ACF8OB_10900 [Phycisphaeraceae bacterium JB051]